MTFHLPDERNKDAWQIAVWNLPDDVISRPQKLQFMQMLEGGFNDFDPFKVVGGLLNHRAMWQGVVMDRAHLLPSRDEGRWDVETDFIKLRDIEHAWNVDSVFILAREGSEADWRALVDDWGGEFVRFLEGANLQKLMGAYVAREGLKFIWLWWD